jgi:hypothetical protein
MGNGRPQPAETGNGDRPKFTGRLEEGYYGVTAADDVDHIIPFQGVGDPLNPQSILGRITMRKREVQRASGLS